MGIAEGELKVGDRVVYPNQGVCRVVGTAEMEIGGQKESFVKLSREDDNATVMVPKGRLEKVGLRRIADPAELRKVFAYLSSPVEGPELDWKVRHRTHGERMSEGGLMGLAQVVKGLTTLADLRPLPPKERELYDNARHLLVSEVAAAAQIADVSAEDAVDLALFPPGVERKKPEIPLPLAGEDAEDLGLDDGVDLAGDGLEGIDAAATPEGEAAKADGEGEEAAGETDAGDEEAEEAPEEPEKPAAKKHAPRAAPEKPPRAAAREAPTREAKADKPKAAKATRPAKPAAKPKPKPEKPEKAKAKPKPVAKPKLEKTKPKPAAKAKAAKPSKK
jgi:CarD family transcriptional regulator